MASTADANSDVGRAAPLQVPGEAGVALVVDRRESNSVTELFQFGWSDSLHPPVDGDQVATESAPACA